MEGVVWHSIWRHFGSKWPECRATVRPVLPGGQAVSSAPTVWPSPTAAQRPWAGGDDRLRGGRFGRYAAPYVRRASKMVCPLGPRHAVQWAMAGCGRGRRAAGESAVVGRWLGELHSGLSREGWSGTTSAQCHVFGVTCLCVDRRHLLLLLLLLWGGGGGKSRFFLVGGGKETQTSSGDFKAIPIPHPR